MIPVKLKMHNFMCYRGDVPPLSFAGIHTACICGDNGNGKSAMIDAITWALWGHARAKSDDELIHLGETKMEVEFDSAIGGQLYRIIRKRAKPKGRARGGQSSLDLLIASNDGFKVISGDRITETQQKLIALLHMDYDTFINSAYLRQGHADEFTKQPPAKRKEVLANILGLAFYDQLEERAKELARGQQSKKAQLETAIFDISQELAQKPDLEAELLKIQSELTHLEDITREQQLKLDHMRQEKQSLENKKLEMAQLEEYITATRRELKLREEEIRQYYSYIKDYEELIARRPAIEKGYHQLSQARKLNEELNHKLAQLVKLNERKSQLEKVIQRAQAELNTDHTVAQNKLTELEAISQRLPQLKDELQKLKLWQRQLTQMEEELGQKRQAYQQLQTKVYELNSSQNRLTQEIKEIAEKLNLLSTQIDAKCPLCETELGNDGLELILTKYTADRQKKIESLKPNEAALGRKKLELTAVENEVLHLEIALNQDKASLQSKFSLLNKGLTEADEASSRLRQIRKELAEIEQRLANKNFATAKQEALGKLENELVSLNYNSIQHEEVQGRLKTLEDYEHHKQRLTEADRLIAQEKEAVAKAGGAAKELSHRLETNNQKRQSLVSELNSLPQLDNALRQAEDEHQAFTEKQRQAQEIVGSVKGRLEHLSKQEVGKQERERQLAKTAKEEKLYKDLAQAFGKKGIQAMLIEMALPEIEAEANRLLGRMTDNRMHLKIEAQRTSKKGDLLETLDINIADELGTRNYEMFSGGEAFRINFAIRIALSKLLARRAGAPLPTLIIDEGFGTQDSYGIDKLKEAIHSIRDDFDKILVITHIEELKDAFPVRINVVKTAQGSTLEVS
jgi:exonuclease SbcC